MFEGNRELLTQPGLEGSRFWRRKQESESNILPCMAWGREAKQKIAMALKSKEKQFDYFSTYKENKPASKSIIHWSPVLPLWCISSQSFL